MYIAPEHVISRALREHSLWRINFLGDGRGTWLLHPPYRSEQFYQALPDLVRRVETGDIPDGQRGDFDVNESLLDWSSARSLRTRAVKFGRGVLARAAAPPSTCEQRAERLAYRSSNVPFDGRPTRTASWAFGRRTRGGWMSSARAGIAGPDALRQHRHARAPAQLRVPSRQRPTLFR